MIARRVQVLERATRWCAYELGAASYSSSVTCAPHVAALFSGRSDVLFRLAPRDAWAVGSVAMTLDEAMRIFETSTADEWTTARSDPDTGSSSALYLSQPGLSIVSYFPRASDKSSDLGEPWVQPGGPAAWPGSVRVLSGVVELVEVPGFSVRATARVPEPDSPDDRAVEGWKIGLFRISSLLEYEPEARAGYGQAQFDEAVAALGITTR